MFLHCDPASSSPDHSVDKTPKKEPSQHHPVIREVDRSPLPPTSPPSREGLKPAYSALLLSHVLYPPGPSLSPIPKAPGLRRAGPRRPPGHHRSGPLDLPPSPGALLGSAAAPLEPAQRAAAGGALLGSVVPAVAG